ncbi:MAG: hut operon positive regulator HutP [Bacillales bacterium]|jgi:hypothetical protein|nr:hut operon positive regulator HutP [Bacillales bacterium]
MKVDSIDVAKASIELAISTREGEKVLEQKYKEQNILTVAVDVGGNINNSISKMLERALVAAKRNGVIKECHSHEGAVIGAAREALNQISAKANGLNVGGKIGIARSGEHLSIAIFMSIGVLHLNDLVIGIGHRSISDI